MQPNESSAPAPRLPLKMDVQYRRSYARQGNYGVLKNISLTGAFLETTEGTSGLKPQDKLTVRFTVGGRVRQISASVVWHTEGGCGIQFHPFNNRDVQIVDDLMYFVENNRKTSRSVLDAIFKKVG